jgi:type I restriction enzyme M protein
MNISIQNLPSNVEDLHKIIVIYLNQEFMSNISIKPLLQVLKFTPENGSIYTWIKNYSNHSNYQIKLDLSKQIIDYGSDIIIGDKSTSNFDSDENFVVLECVNRLLEQGYKPQNITLEKRWPTGHGTREASLL